MIPNYTAAINGRIWIFWRGHLKVQIISVMDQCVTLHVEDQGRRFYVSVVYGQKDGEGRRNLWKHLIEMKVNVGNCAWMLAVDFNVLLDPSESSRFDGSQMANLPMREFKECLNEIGTFDHPFLGSIFTWLNNQEDTFQVRKLDRALINCEWVDLFPNSVVEFIAPGVSDHCPIVVRNLINAIRPKSPFKFFNFWTGHDLFLETVGASWQRHVDGNPM